MTAGNSVRGTGKGNSTAVEMRPWAVAMGEVDGFLEISNREGRRQKKDPIHLVC